MDRKNLEELLESGKSTNEIAKLIGLKSGSTVRFWMKKFGLKSIAKSGQKTKSIENGLQKFCRICNTWKLLNDFAPRKDRPGTLHTTCKTCWSENSNNRYFALKETLVKYKGGLCNICNGEFPLAVYAFHHTGDGHKDFNLSEKKYNSFKSVIDEVDKCILLCHNCHTKIHHEMKQKQGLTNKINGNTELWRENKIRKLNFIGTNECNSCGYNDYVGSLGIIFKDNMKNYRKYNKTHWDDKFKDALKQAQILCLNCVASKKI